MTSWITERSPEPWREKLRPASFRNAVFHVETGGKTSGRRIALHEYPKRDTPYAEDMGKRTTVFDITGYVIEWDAQLGRDYTRPRDRLIEALEKEGPAALIHPTLRDDLQVVCERYSIREDREKGGYAVFEMHFIEAGSAGNGVASTNTSSAAIGTASAMSATAGGAFKSGIGATVPR
jgi:prophage DNA circulation protein